MGGADPVDDLTFSLQFSADGAAKLRERVNEKLKELMGDYTDETLVEYVIVLLKNGRRKEEAKNELNVFLGDDSDSFVSWLWDHLGSNISLYVQPVESVPDESTKGKPATKYHGGRDDSHNLDSGSDREKASKLSRSRHNREWKSLVRDTDEPPPFQSSAIHHVRTDERIQRKVVRGRRSPSPQPPIQRKRNRPDEQQHTKRVASQATINVPRRLLQFAVRDAVATARTSNSTSEPALKRLRSVVSTSAGDSSVDVRPRIRSIARVPSAMTTAIKAVEEAAKDVVRNKATSNVFDRLGRGKSDQLSNAAREEDIEDVDYGGSNRITEEDHFNYPQRSDYTEEYTRDTTMFETETGVASDSASDIEGYDDVNVEGQRVVGAPPVSASGENEGQESMTVQYSVAKNANEKRNSWKDQDQTAAAGGTSRKIVNISVNVNTWKPPQYQEPRELSEMDSRKTVQEAEAGVAKPGVWLMKDSSNPVTTSNGNVKPAADAQKDSQKTVPTVPVPYSTGRPTEDADSRTIFVNNVHFAATKDSLSRHFNKFGDVLKVVIVTDAATGQPKGSAYVEFMRKDAAENALSLDGTSFMSRILKVVRKSAAHLEAAPPMMTWPRAMRGSPFASSRFPRASFPRGGVLSGGYRGGRPPMRGGARSMQWKRDAAATTPSDNNNASAAAPTTNTTVAPPPAAGRGLTYVRVEPKTNGSSSAA